MNRKLLSLGTALTLFLFLASTALAGPLADKMNGEWVMDMREFLERQTKGMPAEEKAKAEEELGQVGVMKFVFNMPASTISMVLDGVEESKKFTVKSEEGNQLVMVVDEEESVLELDGDTLKMYEPGGAENYIPLKRASAQAAPLETAPPAKEDPAKK